MITYHFQTKEQLYEDVIAQIAQTAADFMTPLIGLHATRRDRLRAYITANIQFIAEFPEHVRALQEIVAHLPRVSAARAMTDEASIDSWTRSWTANAPASSAPSIRWSWP